MSEKEVDILEAYIEPNLAFYDFEVTRYDWLCTIILYKAQEHKFVFHNDWLGLQAFIQDYFYYMAGYNVKGYDQYILKGILLGMSNTQLKELNDWIIAGNQGWQWDGFKHAPYVEVPPQVELMFDIVPRKSLKEIEGNMGLSIEESSVNFDIERPWNEEEREMMMFYNEADVNACALLYAERRDYFRTKLDLTRDVNISYSAALSNTNANVVAMYLGAEGKNLYNPLEKYEFPTCIDYRYIPDDVMEFFKRLTDDWTPSGGKYTDSDDIPASEKYKTLVCGVPTTLGSGGIHGALENYFEAATDSRVILNADAFSYYPSTMLLFDLLSRNCSHSERFKDAWDIRYDAKFNKNSKVSQTVIKALKLLLNTTYGASGAKFNGLYDPLKCISVCVHGQLFLIYLASMIQDVAKSAQFIQYNTDGLMLSVDKIELPVVERVIKEFMETTGYIMEIDHIKGVWQRDVNNYIVEMENGKVKSKGAVFSAVNKAKFESNSMRIVSQAVLDYFVKNIPIADTINACDNPTDFQMIAKTGSTFQDTIYMTDDGLYTERLQKVNRLYAVKPEYAQEKNAKGCVYKVKLTTDTTNNKGEWGFDDERRTYVKGMNAIPNCPSYVKISNKNDIFLDMIDKTWYIEYAIREVEKFIGGKKTMKPIADAEPDTEKTETVPEKETSKKATTKKESKPKEEPLTVEVRFRKKVEAMRKQIAQWELPKDGYNKMGDYVYVKAFNYKQMLSTACIDNGVDFAVEITDVQTLPMVKSEKMELVRIRGIITLIDVETGYGRDYTLFADGMDMGDKGLYKAYTMLIKSFVQMNFLRSDNEELDVEKTDEITDSHKNNIPPSATERVSIEKKVSSTPATAAVIDDIVNMVLKIRSKEPDYMKTDPRINEINNGTLSSTEATKLVIFLEQECERYGV